MADDPNNTLTSGFLTTLHDKSGNSRDATAYGGSSGRAAFITTLNGRNVWRADSASGTDKGIFSIANINALTNGVGGWTMIALHASNPAPGSTDQSVVRFNNNSTAPRAMIGKGLNTANYAYAAGRRLDGNTTVIRDSGAAYGTDWVISSAVFNYSSTNLRFATNGSTQTNSSFQTAGLTSTTDSASNGLGHDGAGGAIADGDFAEVFIYNRALSLNEQYAIEGYLAWSWGLETSLASNHPFRYSPPKYPFEIVDNAAVTGLLTGAATLDTFKTDALTDAGAVTAVLTGTYA